MEKYWKLLDIENDTYTTHETEEEVNHIIDFNTRHLDDDKVTKRITISTPFANYDFQFVSVFDEHHVHQFLYFFDAIEEEYDSLAERTCDMSIDPCIDTPLIRDLAYEYKDMMHKICNEFDERTKSLMERIRELESHSATKLSPRECEYCIHDVKIVSESNQLDELRKRFDSLVKEDTSRILSLEEELQKLQEQRDNLVNKNAELEGKLIRYAGKIDELEGNNSTLKEAYEHTSKLYRRSQDELFTARRSRDFWHKKFLDIVSPDDLPF